MRDLRRLGLSDGADAGLGGGDLQQESPRHVIGSHHTNRNHQCHVGNHPHIM